MHELIASRFMDEFLLVRPGCRNGVNIGQRRYAELAASVTQDQCPAWLLPAVARAWPDLSPPPGPVGGWVLVRPVSRYGYARASYEMNLGCNYDCPVCYLGVKQFSGLDWADRVTLLGAMAEAGVLFLQLTGGEPLIDKLFADVYGLAFELGMMISVSTNGSRLSSPKTLTLLNERRPYRVTVSVYGATAPTYEAVTGRRGSFRSFSRGLVAAQAADLNLQLNVIVVKDNAHEVDAMIAIAERLGVPHTVYTNISPTIYGGPESLPSQSEAHLRQRKVFTGCNAGHTFFHADPHGRVSICKVGRDEQISLVDEGAAGLTRLSAIADSLLLRTGGCSGCQLSGACTVCRPLAKRYQQARAPLHTYCQHGQQGRR
jgi:MoaA/NifB/PqqE/SkfB family radical SAM enzyme